MAVARTETGLPPESHSVGASSRPQISPSPDTNQPSNGDIFHDRRYRWVRPKIDMSALNQSLNREPSQITGNSRDKPTPIAQNGHILERKTPITLNGKDSDMGVKPEVKISQPTSPIGKNDGTEYLRNPELLQKLQEYLNSNPNHTAEGFIKENRREQQLTNHSGGKEHEVPKLTTHRAIMWLRRAARPNSQEEIADSPKFETIKPTEKAHDSLDKQVEAQTITAIDSGLSLGSSEFEEGVRYGVDYMLQNQKPIRAALNTKNPEISQDSTRWKTLLQKKVTRRAAIATGLSATAGAGYLVPRLLTHIPNAARAEELILGPDPAESTNNDAEQALADNTTEDNSSTEAIRGELGEKGYSKFFSALALRAESNLIAPNGVVRISHIQTNPSGEETFVPFAAFRNGLPEEGPGPVKMNINGTEFGDCLVFEWYPQNGQEQVTIASTISTLQSDGSEVIDEEKTQRYVFTPEYTQQPNLPLSDQTKVYFEGDKAYDLPNTWETLEELKQKIGMFVEVDNIIIRDQEWKGKRAKYYDVVGDGKTIVVSSTIDRMVEQDRDMVLLMALSGAWYRQITKDTLQDQQNFEELQLATGGFDLAHYETIHNLETQETPGPVETQNEQYRSNVFAELDTMLDAPKMNYKVIDPFTDPEEEFAKTIAAMMYRPEEIVRFTKTAGFPDDLSMKLLCGAAYRAMEVSLGGPIAPLDTLLGRDRSLFASWSSPLSYEYSHKTLSPLGVGSP